MGTLLVLCLLGAVTVSSTSGLGGFSESSVDVATLHVSDFAVSKINEKVSAVDGWNGVDLELAGVLSSKKQVVAGLRYDLKLVAEAADEQNVFTAQVYLPLHDEPELITYAAVTTGVSAPSVFEDARVYHEYTEEDEEILSAAATAIREINLRANPLEPFELEGVRSAECKVASGQGTTCRLRLGLQSSATGIQEYQVTLSRTLVTKWRLLSANQNLMPANENSVPVT